MARLLEAVVASIIVASALSVSYFYLLPANPYVIRGGTDLDKYGYDVLNTLARQGGFDKAIFDGSGNLVPFWEQRMDVVLGSVIPPDLFFNLTVYNATVAYSGVQFFDPATGSYVSIPDGLVVFARWNSTSGAYYLNVPLNTIPISNANSTAFLNAGQVSQVTFIYTTKYIEAPSKGFYLMMFELQLARATRI